MTANAVDAGLNSLIPGGKEVSQHLWLVPDSIADGKTLAVTDGHKENTLQLCGVAVSEGDQVARDHLRELVDIGNGAVIVVPIKKNRSGQTLADVFITKSGEEEIHLNSQMILDGLASVDAQEVGQCPQPEVLARAEDIAKEQ
ncbi:thermonuclease family protein [Leptothoe kymatousa]|uniref:Thermonuclease family protein n=1 Tax=Leptothoe kymatousa TAU-MAC 1615 TaxID=2364775 RepID=A0ABS5Y3Y3_9CYAN|nr:thermonuclease family protein [Leptothoe kymatousa]MBT9312544.1 thermonuclease family protein [Leptothoe kymatousa TAU-MAC 1615]